MISEAERRFPVRLRLAVPAGGLGARLAEMHAWLDDNAGVEGWVMTPAGVRGVVNDAVAIYLREPAIAAAFVARWCAGDRPEVADGAFRICDDEPARRLPTAPHRTP